MRKIWIILMYCFNLSAFASSCHLALPTNDPNFCPSFKAAATCYCSESGLPNGVCLDMHTLYNRMMIVFKNSLEKACKFQHHTSTQDCVDNWSCYLAGGVDSTGKSCSSTGLPCE